MVFLAQSSIDLKISAFLGGMGRALFALNPLGWPKHFSATLNPTKKKRKKKKK